VVETSPALAGLNSQQREAVAAVAGPVLILAGAGSGKTRVITHRIAHLVLDRGVASDQILAVTFTNKAAEEMRARAEALLGGQALRASMSTFHSFCVRLLRREARAAGLDPGFLIYDEDDQLAAVREAMRRLDLSEKLHPPRRFLARISARKNSAPGEPDDGADLTGEVMKAYRVVLDAASALDFDDLLLRAVALLDAAPQVCAGWRARFPYLLVDEYQDTNRAQYQLVRLLAGPGGNLTVVGDEDQSIYSWRGADISNILDFEHDFPGARVFRLEQNYRSSQRILDAAGALVARNQRRKGKALVAVKGAGELVRLHEAADEFEEAAWVTGRTAALRARGRVAVLFRMNAQSRLVEEGLLRLRLPYLVLGGVGFYARREVKDVLAYLRLVANPRDGVAFRRIVNVPPRGIGAKTLDEIDRVARERGASAWDAAGFLVDAAALPGRALSPLRQFRETIETLREEGLRAAGGTPRLGLRGLLERVLALSGYAAALAREDSHESQDRLENLAELIAAAADFEAREPQAGLAGFLDRTALLSETDRLRDDVPVLLMTLHAAKGLEFESVFVVGLEEGLLPHSRSLTAPEGLEEERRLCYVGMTRARDALHLSWARSRQVFGQRRLSEKSRFLEELPEELLEKSGGQQALQPWRAERPAWARERPPAPTSGDAPARPLGEAGAIRAGARVRHPLFGVGTVLRREGDGDDFKVTVSFPGVGAKKLVARYAGLEVV
jgi:DNA helicase-2/ATP-dependent DNA helicase PcrA